MGNTVGIGGSKTTAKIMNINGETTKYKTPIQSLEITKHHPGHVLLESGSVKLYGVRAKPLDPTHLLEPKKVYFLVELPKNHIQKETRRVRSSGDIQVGAKEKLESLMMTRRSVSDLSVMKTAGRVVVDKAAATVTMRVSKAELERMVRESKDHTEAAEKIVGFCMEKTGPGLEHPGLVGFKRKESRLGLSGPDQRHFPQLGEQPRREKSPLGRVQDGYKKRVGFLPVHEADIHQLVVAS